MIILILSNYIRNYFQNQISVFRKILDPSTSSRIPVWVSDWMLLTAVLNSCVNPLIYGWYYYRDTPAS